MDKNINKKQMLRRMKKLFYNDLEETCVPKGNQTREIRGRKFDFVWRYIEDNINEYFVFYNPARSFVKWCSTNKRVKWWMMPFLNSLVEEYEEEEFIKKESNE